jgi:hypothetical protein
MTCGNEVCILASKKSVSSVGDSLIHVGGYYKPLASHVLLLKGKKGLEINGHQIWTVGRLVRNMPAATP